MSVWRHGAFWRFEKCLKNTTTCRSPLHNYSARMQRMLWAPIKIAPMLIDLVQWLSRQETIKGCGGKYGNLESPCPPPTHFRPYFRKIKRNGGGWVGSGLHPIFDHPHSSPPKLKIPEGYNTPPGTSPEQVSGPGGVYISPRDTLIHHLDAEGAQDAVCGFPEGKCIYHLGREAAPGMPPWWCDVSFWCSNQMFG